eukprot:m.202573 g.202573  ORF g.202573 m.202573 type:complete len:469 (-) comp18837_c0_seq5:64-1470(-)
MFTPLCFSQGGSITLKVGKYKTRGQILASGFSVHRSTEQATEYELNLATMKGCFITDDSVGQDFVKLVFNGTSNDTALISNHHTLGGVDVSDPILEVVDGESYWTSVVSLKATSAEDVYTVAFHRCDVSSMHVGSVSATIEITEVNPGPDYVGAGLAPVDGIYLIMSIAFFACAVAWGGVLWQNRSSPRLFKVHYLMLALVLAKSLSLLFRGLDYHYIKTTGKQEEGFAVMFYIAHFAKGIMLFIVIVLIGAGFGFVKHALSQNERAIFMIVIPLQVLSGIAWIVIEESAEGSASRSTWTSLGLLIDLICCGAILFPVVWSIRHLREASETDGKAAASLSKLRLFRRFYVMVLAYIYVTRILVYLVANSMPFRYEWLGPFFSEAVSLFFYITTGVMFSPESDNEYLKVPEEDPDDFEHIAMDDMKVTTSAVSDGMKRVNKSKPHDEVASPSSSTVLQQKKDMGLEPDF